MFAVSLSHSHSGDETYSATGSSLFFFLLTPAALYPDVPVVPAALAYECFNTVPLGKDEAIKLVDAIEPYLEWQSDAAFKKNPPKDYAYPGFDMFANLANVKSNLQAGKYASEYEFQIDLYKQVWAPGQDGHFVFYPDLLSKAFKFKRQSLPLVSISEDGTSLPQIKLQRTSFALLLLISTCRGVQTFC